MIDDLAEQATLQDRTVPLGPGLVVPVARYAFTFRMLDALVTPAYAGSLLRGQFGAALRRIACMTGMETCQGCLLRSTCPYSTVFEAPAPSDHRLQKFSEVPNPYVIEPHMSQERGLDAGAIFGFSVVLIGHALQHLPLIIFAFERAFARGIGKQRSRGELVSVIHEGSDGSTVVWEPGVSAVGDHSPRLEIPRFDDIDRAALVLTTPLRLQANGQPLRPGQVSPRKLVTTLLRRATLLLEPQMPLPGIDAQARGLADLSARLDERQDLRWFDWTRYSSRQDREMTLGGVVGRWELRGAVGALLPALWLGQWLHVGKNASMGLGRYALELGGPAE